MSLLISIQFGGKCDLWNPETIGQTFAILDIKASCWIYWLADGEKTAMANCSKHQLIGKTRQVHAKLAMLIDSRGDEVCTRKRVVLLPLNHTRVYEIGGGGNYTSEAGKTPAFLRVLDAIGSLRVAKNKTYWTKMGNDKKIGRSSFNYSCVISKRRYRKIRSARSNNNECRFNIEYHGLNGTTIFLDANHTTKFNITLSLTKSMPITPYLDELPPVVIQRIEPSRVKLQTVSHIRSSQMTIRVLLTQKIHSTGTSLLNIYATTQPSSCRGSHKKITIQGGCPPGKHLKFEYPMSLNEKTWLYGNPADCKDIPRIATLPYNYQPPSHLGKAIPLTPNIYNADPSRPMHRDSYKISRDVARLKQCKGKLSRYVKRKVLFH